MSHGYASISSRGRGIYCGEHHVKLTDGRVVPLSLATNRSSLHLSNTDLCADGPPAHVRAAAPFADRDLGVGAQPSDVQATAIPIFRHAQTTHAISQPTNAAAGGADDLTYHCGNRQSSLAALCYSNTAYLTIQRLKYPYLEKS